LDTTAKFIDITYSSLFGVGFFFSLADKILVKGQKSKELNVQFSMLNIIIRVGVIAVIVIGGVDG